MGKSIKVTFEGVTEKKELVQFTQKPFFKTPFEDGFLLICVN